MAGPWEDYAAQPAAASAGPWADYASGGASAPAASAPPARSDGFFGNLAGGVIEPLAAMASGLVARPVSQVAGLAAAGREMFPGAPQGDPQAFQQDIQRSMTYEPKTAAGQSPMNPLNFIPQLLGQLVSSGAHGVGNFIAPPGSEPGREAVGRGVTEALEQAPGFVGLKAPAGAAAAAPVLRSGAERTMQSALKPSLKAQQTGKADRAIGTMLDEGINVSPGGMEKVADRITALNDQIKTLIQDSPAKIDKSAVAATLSEKLGQVAKQVTPKGDLAAIQRAWDEFMSHPLLEGNRAPLRADKERPAIERTIRKTAADQPGPAIANTLEQVAGEQPGSFTAPPSMQVPPPAPTIPVQLAQEMKQGTYRALGDKSYGELKGADIEAQKALARGLKQEIVKAVPAVRELNAQESALLNALSVSERRVMMEANKNPIGLGILSTNPLHLAAWMADRSGLFKSLIARMLNQTSESLPGMARAGPAMGLAVGQQAQQYGAPTGPPPQ